MAIAIDHLEPFHRPFSERHRASRPVQDVPRHLAASMSAMGVRYDRQSVFRDNGARRPLWLRSPKTDSKPADQLGREGMIEVGLVGGDARITIRRESPDDVGFREIFVSLDGEQIAILRPYETFTQEIEAGAAPTASP